MSVKIIVLGMDDICGHLHEVYLPKKPLAYGAVYHLLLL